MGMGRGGAQTERGEKEGHREGGRAREGGGGAALFSLCSPHCEGSHNSHYVLVWSATW